MTQSQESIRSGWLIRSVVDACADCDTCRFLMDETCLFFPELYRLADREAGEKKPASDDELRKLSDLCTFCGLCPCPDIRRDILQSRIARVRETGLSLQARLLSEVHRIGRLCGMAPKVANAILSFPIVARAAKSLAGMDPDRRMPVIPRENFFSWARRNGLDRKTDAFPKVAYFAGCTAGYFFPEVAQSTVLVLAKNGVSVYVPEQECCGMPMLLEGDSNRASGSVQRNLDILLETIEDGYDPVCSCPTCGYLMKVLLREGACFSSAYQESVRAAAGEIRMPGRISGKPGFVSLKKSLYPKILRDDGLFSRLDPLARLALADRVLDAGEYLHRLYRENRLNACLGEFPSRMAHFAPCHQREQDIQSPYETLLRLIPGLQVVKTGGVMDCCGMGGHLGFTEAFSQNSISIGRSLFQKIREVDPEGVITDCLSCRMQLKHVLPYPVVHPMEVLRRSYGEADRASRSGTGSRA